VDGEVVLAMEYGSEAGDWGRRPAARLGLFDTFGVGQDEVAAEFRSAGWPAGRGESFSPEYGGECDYAVDVALPGTAVDRAGVLAALGPLPRIDLGYLGKSLPAGDVAPNRS
jgi:hypothetical protein